VQLNKATACDVTSSLKSQRRCTREGHRIILDLH